MYIRQLKLAARHNDHCLKDDSFFKKSNKLPVPCNMCHSKINYKFARKLFGVRAGPTNSLTPLDHINHPKMIATIIVLKDLKTLRKYIGNYPGA